MTPGRAAGGMFSRVERSFTQTPANPVQFHIIAKLGDCLALAVGLVSGSEWPCMEQQHFNRIVICQV